MKKRTTLFSKRVLVTGGLGFIGSAFLREYVPQHRSWLFVNLDDHREGSNEEAVAELVHESNYVFEKCALEDTDKVTFVMLKHGITDVIHFAAYSDVDQSIREPIQVFFSNTCGTQNLLEGVRAVRNIGVPFKRFVYVSTDEVYGPAFDGECFDETAQINPKNPYSASKAASEHLVRSYGNTYDINYVITRGCNTFGPWQRPTKLIPLSVKKLVEGKKVPIYGNGEQVRQWMSLGTHINGVHAAWRNGLCGETYNICAEDGVWNKDIIRRIIDIVKPGSAAKDDTFMEEVPDRPGHDVRYSINGDKIRRIYTQLQPNPKAFEHTVRWYIDYWRRYEKGN